MNDLITLQVRSPSRNSRGESLPGWAELDQVLSRFRELRGKEFFRAAKSAAETIAEFVIHYRDDVTPENRVLHGSDVYDIREAVNVGERDMWLKIVGVLTE